MNGINEPVSPVIRHAPPGELRIYTISEQELESLARGGDVSLSLNIGISLVSIFVTVLITFLTVQIPAGYKFQGFFSTALVTLILGGFFLYKGVQEYRGNTSIANTIKNRMLPEPGIQVPPQRT